MGQMHSPLSEFTLKYSDMNDMNVVSAMSQDHRPRFAVSSEVERILTTSLRRPFLPAVLRRPPADPLGESVGEDKWIVVTDFMSDGFNRQFG
jgi:hypothetical protein